MTSYRKTFLEVNLTNLEYNYDFYKNKTKKAIFTVVKANAYGMGAVEIARCLEKLNTDYLGVATLDEAVELRQAGIIAPILVMGYVAVNDVKIAIENNITLTVVSLTWAKNLTLQGHKNLKLHLKVNTTMNRLGHNSLEEVLESINLLKNNHNLEGIFTHYCCEDNETALKDFNHFKNIVESLNFDFKWIHASNSYNALYLEENLTNAIRIGIGLYGGYKEAGLKNIASLKTEVAQIRMLNANETVSYGATYTAQSKMKIAVLTIGYADGVLRMDTGSNVWINNNYYPIVGTICMDQLMVAIDDKVAENAMVEIFGEHIDVEAIAKSRKTIIYEVFTTISTRVFRKYIR
ncbi:MAG: alanine racemase [Erysipelothrix sp.]|nr:alanine racemase [Erysipelothrix sp.]